MFSITVYGANELPNVLFYECRHHLWTMAGSQSRGMHMKTGVKQLTRDLSCPSYT